MIHAYLDFTMDIRMILLVVCVFAFFTKSFSIQQESTVRQMKGLRDEVQNLTQRLQKLNATFQKDEAGHARFYAVIKEKTLNYNADTILVFETVIVNEGGFYDKYDGVFVAPWKGTYMFSWTVSANGGHWIVTELVVESQIISTAGVKNNGGGYPSGSMTAFCKMEKGDHAWIRSTGVSTGHVIYSHDNYPQSSFLGLLIHAD